MGLALVLLVLFSATAVTVFSECSDDSEAAYVDGLPHYSADVTPFTFPECRGVPVKQALLDADTSIDISIYYMPSKDIMAILKEKQENGVMVRVLVEGKPLGVDTEEEMRMLKMIDNLGGDVRIINQTGNNSEYPYVHNKYAVIDGDTVIVTSENWTKSNMGTGGNRGWGAIIESSGYADHMEQVFKGDYDVGRTGVDYIETVYPNLEPYTDSLTYSISDAYTVPDKITGVEVSPVHSPDTSFVSMKNFMGIAETRLYAEEMDVSKNYAKLTTDAPLAWMNAKADAGIDVKFVLNTSYENDGIGEHNDLVSLLNGSTNIKAAGIHGHKETGKSFDLTHNKGIIVDDMVWVGSVNWTETSMTQNREVAVIIYSKAAADFYAGFFEKDFDENYASGDFTATFIIDEKNKIVKWYDAGEKIVAPTYIPTKADDGKYSYKFSHWEGYSEGNYITSDVTYTAVFDKEPLEEEMDIPWYIIAAVIAIAVLGMIFKGRKHRH